MEITPSHFPYYSKLMERSLCAIVTKVISYTQKD